MASNSPSELIPAATVLLLKNGTEGLEVLLLRRNRDLKAFGGAWVFPGGRVDAMDGPGQDVLERSRHAAIRETSEETSLDISKAPMETLSNWIPPKAEIRRFSTWFFLAKAPDDNVIIDQGEIHDFQWVNPGKFIQNIPSPNIRLFPPTYISLWQLQKFQTAEDALQHFQSQPAESFETKFQPMNKGFVTYWQGDCAYEDDDLNKSGPRRRLYAGHDKWEYICET